MSTPVILRPDQAEKLDPGVATFTFPDGSVMIVPPDPVPDDQVPFPDMPLTASARCTFEFREEDHPRERGRFVEKDGGGDGGEKPHVSLREPGQKLTKPMVVARSNKISRDVADFYGSDIVAKVEVDQYGIMQGGYAGVRNLDLTGRGREEVILINPALVENLREADSGIRDFRVVAHEAVHASVGGPDGVLPGFSKDYEEGAAEILSIHYWDQRGQPMGPDDAFVREDRQEGQSRWTAPGNETLAASVVYRDEVTELMTRAASAAGEWDRQAVVAEVLEVMRGGHTERLRFRDATDPEFPPPEGVDRDAESLVRWLIEDDTVTAAARFVSAFDFDEDAHPRGEGGRFTDAHGRDTSKSSTPDKVDRMADKYLTDAYKGWSEPVERGSQQAKADAAFHWQGTFEGCDRMQVAADVYTGMANHEIVGRGDDLQGASGAREIVDSIADPSALGHVDVEEPLYRAMLDLDGTLIERFATGNQVEWSIASFSPDDFAVEGFVRDALAREGGGIFDQPPVVILQTQGTTQGASMTGMLGEPPAFDAPEEVVTGGLWQVLDHTVEEAFGNDPERHTVTIAQIDIPRRGT